MTTRNEYIDGSPMSAKDSARADAAKFAPCGCRINDRTGQPSHVSGCSGRTEQPNLNAATAARPQDNDLR